MMAPVRLEDPGAIAAILRRNVPLHLYGLGDLDDRFRPRTTWYADPEEREAVLVYRGPGSPTLLAFTDEVPRMLPLLEAILSWMPTRFEAQITPGLEAAFPPEWNLLDRGRFLRMILADPAPRSRGVHPGCRTAGAGERRGAHRLLRPLLSGELVRPLDAGDRALRRRVSGRTHRQRRWGASLLPGLWSGCPGEHRHGPCLPAAWSRASGDRPHLRGASGERLHGGAQRSRGQRPRCGLLPGARFPAILRLPGDRGRQRLIRLSVPPVIPFLSMRAADYILHIRVREYIPLWYPSNPRSEGR